MGMMKLYLPYEDYHFFYGGFGSQWLACEFKVDGVQYNCAEQYMMAKKASLFKDYDALQRIMKARHPRDQKAEGRKVRGFDPDQWNAVARDVVYRGNIAKFTQNPGLWYELKRTEGMLLVEASPTDVIWGIGMAEGADGIEDCNNWKGTNWLGEVLTRVRDDILGVA